MIKSKSALRQTEKEALWVHSGKKNQLAWEVTGRIHKGDDISYQP